MEPTQPEQTLNFPTLKKLLKKLLIKVKYGVSLSEDEEELQLAEGKEEMIQLLIKITKISVSALRTLGVNSVLNLSSVSLDEMNISDISLDLGENYQVEIQEEEIQIGEEGEEIEIKPIDRILNVTDCTIGETAQKDGLVTNLEDKISDQKELIKNLVDMLKEKNIEICDFKKNVEIKKSNNKMLKLLFKKCEKNEKIRSQFIKFKDRFENCQKFILPYFTTRPTALQWLINDMKEITIELKVEEFSRDFLDIFVDKGSMLWRYCNLYKDIKKLKYFDENPAKISI